MILLTFHLSSILLHNIKIVVSLKLIMHDYQAEHDVRSNARFTQLTCELKHLTLQP
jgi:hypothetical protein